MLFKKKERKKKKKKRRWKSIIFLQFSFVITFNDFLSAIGRIANVELSYREKGMKKKKERRKNQNVVKSINKWGKIIKKFHLVLDLFFFFSSSLPLFFFVFCFCLFSLIHAKSPQQKREKITTNSLSLFSKDGWLPWSCFLAVISALSLVHFSSWRIIPRWWNCERAIFWEGNISFGFVGLVGWRVFWRALFFFII